MEAKGKTRREKGSLDRVEGRKGKVFKGKKHGSVKVSRGKWQK